MKEPSKQVCECSIMPLIDGSPFWCQTGHFQGIFAQLQGQNGCGSGSSTHKKQLSYSASSCGSWRSQHGHFISKTFSHNYRAKTGVGVDRQHATNDFCIAPPLAGSGAHSMEGLITTDFLMREPSAQVQHAKNDFCIAPRLAKFGARSMDGLITTDGLMKEPSAQVQHATNNFCIAPLLRNPALIAWSV